MGAHSSQAFGAKRVELRENDDHVGEAVYTLLEAVTGLCLANGDSQMPCAAHPGQLPSIGDFDGSALESLATLAPLVDDPELHARVADALWIRRT